MKDSRGFTIISVQEMEDLGYSEEYAQYIMENCGGERVICNGDTLLEAMEDLYLFDDFLMSRNLVCPE